MPSITCNCKLCGKKQTIKTTSDQMVRYEVWNITGGPIQDYLPDLSADDRELLISGTCKKCWENIFGKEEDQWM